MRLRGAAEGCVGGSLCVGIGFKRGIGWTVRRPGSVPYAGTADAMLSDARVRLTTEDVFWVDMRVRILYFGVLQDVVGREREERELAEGTPVSALLKALEEGAESLVWRSVAVAVNRDYVSAAAILCEGDEVALLPPVSGGCQAR